VPEEGSVLCLRSVYKQVVSPDFYGNSSLLGIISKHTGVVALGEFLRLARGLILLVVKVFRRGDTLEHGPGLASGQEGGGEDHSVESQVVLSHELVQLHVLSVLPPLLPLVAVVGGDGDIADGSIEPHIEDFVSVLLERHGSSPLQVTGNASLHETSLKELVGESRSILGPVSFNFSLSHPGCELVSHLGEVDKDMLRLLDHGSSMAHLAVRVL